jgi:5-methylcytosine-specific restriction endonuclease McrA
VTDPEPIHDIVPRVLGRLERLAKGLRAIAAGTGRNATVPREVVHEHAHAAEYAARELRALHGTIPTRQAIPRAVQQLVLDDAYDLEADAYVCAQCGQQETDRRAVHIDHVVPVARGGSNAADNLRVLCAGCNLRKGAAA